MVWNRPTYRPGGGPNDPPRPIDVYDPPIRGWFEATGKHCDEYPFASTLEGAANDFFDFSVKLISVCANCAA